MYAPSISPTPLKTCCCTSDGMVQGADVPRTFFSLPFQVLQLLPTGLAGALFLFLLHAIPSFALSPEDLLIVYNSTMPESGKVAKHYSEQRNIPSDNLVGLKLSSSEQITRKEYEDDLARPLRELVVRRAKAGHHTALLLIYGVPLKVGSVELGGAPHAGLAARRAEDIARITADLAGQLAESIKQNGKKPEFTEHHGGDEGALIKEVEKVIRQAIDFTGSEDGRKSGKNNRVISLLVRLTGITPIAQNLFRQLDLTTEAGREQLSSDTLFKLKVLFGSELTPPHFRGLTMEDPEYLATLIRLDQGLVGELRFWGDLRRFDARTESSASVDSELSLLATESYVKARWLPNPFLQQFDTVPGIQTIRQETLMVARLDGPTPQIAMRLVDDAVAVEKEGLSGNFCIDARGLKNKKDKDNDAYVAFDARFMKLRDIVKENTAIPVIFDDKPTLFKPGTCPDAALYTGWYSLAKYVDAFTWKKGAVGYHVASGEAATLRGKDSQAWCRRMLEDGVAATIGPVEEPYLSSFPLPELFFSLLMTGKLPLLEVYYRSTPYLSWRQVLIGDPLYTPFEKKPALTGE